jgi:hypothetical protein
MNNHENITTQEENENFYAEYEADQFFDDETDERMREECYGKGKMLSAVERLEIVKNLRIEAQKEKDPHFTPEEPDNFLRRHFLGYKEKHPSPYAPTLGIEIEIPDETVLPKELWQENFVPDDSGSASQKFQDERGKYQEKYKVSEQIGVPNGNDLFWEFAHEPARNPLTLSREVQALVGMGLINTKYTKYPLHVTLGGVTSDGLGGDQAHVFSHALEATGWSTNADRLTYPYVSDFSWVVRGEAGVRERGKEEGKSRNDMKTSDEQNIGANVGTEFRTIQLQSLSGLDRYLHSAYYLGTALRSFQEKLQNEYDNDPTLKELSDIWKEFSEKCTEVFQKTGIKEPSEIWTIRREFPDEPSPFKDLAKILEEGTANKESMSAKFIHEMRLLVIQTRTKVKKIIEQNLPTSKE